MPERLPTPPSTSTWARVSRVVVAVIVVMTGVAAVLEHVRQSDLAENRDVDLLQRAVATIGHGSGTFVAAGTAQTIVGEDGWPDARRFQVLADRLLALPGVTSAAAERLVAGEERSRFEDQTGFEIVELNAEGEFEPTETRDMYLPIVEVQPDSFSAILGRDMLAEPVRRSAALRARDTGEVAMTEPTPLTNENRPGVLLMAPLYSLGAPLETVNDRREAFVGLVSISIFSDVFVADLGKSLPRGTRMRITDSQKLVAETDPAPQHGATAEVTVGGRMWTVTVAHPNRGSAVSVPAIIVGGLLVAAVAWIAFRRSTLQAERLEAAHSELAAVVANLQRGLLRDTVEMARDGATAAVRYVPAAQHARLGGDWYDVFRARDGALVLTIGDVAGHGVDAVVQMERIRQSVSAYAYEGRSPAEVLKLTEDSLGTVRPGSQMATVWIGRLETETGTLVHASAGHPPAIISCPGETPQWLRIAGGPPLNTGMSSCAWNEHVDRLKDGCVIAIYTDGIIEARGITLQAGMDRVARCLERPARSLEDIAEEMLAGRPEPGADDAALVVVRWTSPAMAGPPADVLGEGTPSLRSGADGTSVDPHGGGAAARATPPSDGF